MVIIRVFENGLFIASVLPDLFVQMQIRLICWESISELVAFCVFFLKLFWCWRNNIFFSLWNIIENVDFLIFIYLLIIMEYEQNTEV